MPKCKNDPKSSYTGKEPSPRGKGFCAKKERIGSKKRGKDGKMWVVKKRVDGIKLWTRFSSKKKIVKKRKYKMKGGALDYNPRFKGMKNNRRIRPAKYLVSSVTGISENQVRNETTKDFTFMEISEDDILVNLPADLGTNYQLTTALLHNDFLKSKIAIGNPAMTLDLYKQYVGREDIHNAAYGGLKGIMSQIDGECLMVHAASIITSCHVRPTIEFDNPNVKCLTGSLSEQPDIILLNACGIDNTNINLTQARITEFLGYYNNALIDIINQNQITHLCLVQIGLGVFAGANVSKKTLITRIYAEGILSLKVRCPSLTYIYLPDRPNQHFAGFFTDYHEQFKAMALNFEITNEDALGKAFELKKVDQNRKVAYLNPSDSVVTFGSFPVGALCMNGVGSGFVGEEFVGQSTTGIFFNSSLLLDILSGGPMAAAMPSAKPINVSFGNTVGNYAVSVSGSDGGVFPATRNGKKRFIKKVINDIRNNGRTRSFYAIRDPDRLIDGDKIELEGNKLMYYDGYFGTAGTITNHHGTIITPLAGAAGAAQPDFRLGAAGAARASAPAAGAAGAAQPDFRLGAAGAARASAPAAGAAPINYQVGDKVIYTSSRGLGNHSAIIEKINDEKITVRLIKANSLREIRKIASNMSRLAFTSRSQESQNNRINRILAKFNISDDRKNGYRGILKSQIRHYPNVKNSTLEETMRSYL